LGEDQPRKGFGDRLHHRSSQRCGAAGPGLIEAIDVKGQLQARRFGHDPGTVSIKAKWRYNVVDVERQDRAFSEGVPATGHTVCQIRDRSDVVGVRGLHSHVLARSGETGKGRIDVQTAWIRQVGCHQRTAEEMDVFEGINHARGIIEIAEG